MEFGAFYPYLSNPCSPSLTAPHSLQLDSQSLQPYPYPYPYPAPVCPVVALPQPILQPHSQYLQPYSCPTPISHAHCCSLLLQKKAMVTQTCRQTRAPSHESPATPSTMEVPRRDGILASSPGGAP